MSRPSNVAVILRHAFSLHDKPGTDDVHLVAAMRWLCRAHDACERTGVSGGYFPPDGGWNAPYPETTGYIITTFLQFAKSGGDATYIKRAEQMGDWEIEIQMPDGAVRGGIGVNAHPVVFNTGQVILGWLALYRFRQQQRYLDAAMRAGDWLVKCQDEDGGWRGNTFHGFARAYHSRVAWPLLELSDVTSDDRFLQAGRRNVDWVLKNTRENAWLDAMSFKPDEKVLTHTLAYSYRGLLESSRLLPDDCDRIRDVVRRAMEKLLIRYELRKASPNGAPKPLPATATEDWRFDSTYSCATGNAQVAIIWLKLSRLEGDARFLNGALRLIDQLKTIQSLTSGNLGIRGAIPGSYPCWGEYNPFSYPNWATKFFADAILLQQEAMATLEGAG